MRSVSRKSAGVYNSLKCKLVFAANYASYVSVAFLYAPQHASDNLVLIAKFQSITLV